jgi:hypothetical protein
VDGNADARPPDSAVGTDLVRRWLDLRRLGIGLVGFWALYFGIVAPRRRDHAARAGRRPVLASGRKGARSWLGPPFVVGISLWAVFIVLDELLPIFETAAEATHLRLLIAQLLTLVLLRSGGLLDGPAPARGQE